MARREIVERVSNERYTRPRTETEQKIAQFLERMASNKKERGR
jgi:hypothetical protein